VLVILVTCVIGARQVMGFWRDLRRPDTEARRLLPSPLDVRAVGKPLDEIDWRERERVLQSQIDAVREQLKRDREKDAGDARDQRRIMYDKIEAVREELGKQIAAMPAQIVAQLLNTKQLWKGEQD
jgi:hypothetical protein